jgi:iron complex transport system ATP-binding protein
MSTLLVSDLSVRVGDRLLVDAASLRLSGGELVALLGPNGAGKTSLLRASLGLMRASSGSALLDGQDVARLSAMQRARRVSYLPQARPLAWPARVRDVVALGRFAHGASPQRLSAVDSEAVDQALTACDLVELAQRSMDTLSGGETARVHCARAMAAQAPLLVADEPTAALDPRHQFRVLSLIAGYAQSGHGALVVLHDVSLAARFATRLVWMAQGRVLADGPVEETLTEGRIAEAYGMRARVEGRSVSLLGPV